MQIERKFTKAGLDVFDTVDWARRASRIGNLDGSVVFEMKDAEVPASWSQLATDIMVSKYFRKAGVPQTDPETGEYLLDDEGQAITGPERSARQVIHRLAGCWRHWGETHGYFDSEEDAQAFYDELCHMMVHQMCAPNSPQWFNTGLHFAYGLTGPAQGHWITDPSSGETKLADDAYSNPQPHACFIQSVDDDLVAEGGIMDLWTREARLFKYGSGTGTNFSRLRGENEPLSGGGKSSGLMSWLKIGDRAAGAIKSGGTTRRAAKMVCLDLDHPDIESFVNWKVREEIKVAALVAGMKALPPAQREVAERLGLQLDYDFNGEAYATVSGQNSNNSVRIPDAFFQALKDDSDWTLTNRTNGEVAKTIKARALWEQICFAAWQCADPGVQYDSAINAWHTCPGSGRINASNPCSEYMFLDNTACNLASLNLLKFYDSETREFDWSGFEHGVRLWTVVLEISVLMAAFPSREIAQLNYEYRTLGLGFANIGAMLMQAGVPYDSERGRAITGAISAVLTGRSYAASAEMAKEHGPFAGFHKNGNREHMLRVIRNHRRAAYGVARDSATASQHMLGDYETIDIRPVPIDHRELENPQGAVGELANGAELSDRARQAWDDALELGEQYGYRNAQSTVIAPTGTIGLLMDCDTTGVEPDFALVKFKKLAGGGYFKIANQSLKPALLALGYNEAHTRDILTYVMGTLSLDVPMVDRHGDMIAEQSFAQWLKEQGLNAADLKKVTSQLPTVFELQHAFTPFTLGEDTIERLGFTDDAQDKSFSLLRAMGLNRTQVTVLNATICGTQTVEGAPHLKDAHLQVFDCANTCGPKGERFIAPEGHIRMMAAAQPFISGAISKTINLPNSASVDEIASAYTLSWELGLKANALYRDGCKLSQVLNNKMDEVEDVQDEEAIEAGKEEVSVEVAALAGRMAGTAATDNTQVIERIVERIIERPMRRRLADTRASMTHKFNVAGHEGYITVGLYEDQTPGELFITMAKEGSTIGGLMDSLGTAISMALQYGVPVEALVNKFTHQRFEPAGMTHNSDIPFAKSLVDYIFRWLAMEFIPGYRAANAPMRPSKQPKEVDLSQVQPASEKAERAETVAASNVEAGKAALKARAAEGDEDDDALGKTDTTGGNGNGRGDRAKWSAQDEAKLVSRKVGEVKKNVGGDDKAGDSALATAMKELQADAPACDVCGTITVRNGTCYKCLNCGNSMGCS